MMKARRSKKLVTLMRLPWALRPESSTNAGRLDVTDTKISKFGLILASIIIRNSHFTVTTRGK